MKIIKDKDGKVVEFTINRKTWVRGGNDGVSALKVPETGKMCCLGHFGRAYNIPICDLVNRASYEDYSFGGIKMPEALKDIVLAKLESSVPIANSDFSEEAIYINDHLLMDDTTREKELTELFASVGVKVTFWN